MTYRPFTVKTKKAALARSGGLCEAEGAFYGLEEGKRCNASLADGVEFDHVHEDGFGGDNSLENCAAVCIPCHRFKTSQGTKRMRKADRQGKPPSLRAKKGRPLNNRAFINGREVYKSFQGPRYVDTGELVERRT